MAISVDRLRKILVHAEWSANEAEKFGGITDGYDAGVAQAIRELIAVKEAEPVAYAWVGYLDRSYTEFPAIQEREPNTVPLIRKPE